jgi:hypothetical protein
MSKSTSAAGAHFTRSRTGEAVMEVGLAAGAAIFTAAIWLSVGAWAIAPQQALETAAAAQAQAVKRVTLPTVHIVGRRDTLEGTPVTTTAQNTAANTVTISQ